MDSAVILDVDGVLLELTHDEEEVFFTALSRFVPTQDLSRDWNSYRIRNDDDIIAEILEHHGLAAGTKQQVIRHYISLLNDALESGLQSVAIRGASQLLNALRGTAHLGIATANLLSAAKLRLQQVNLWAPVHEHAAGADGGGHKHEILGRLLKRISVPPSRVVYVGDNLNDLEAGLRHGVHFIGFSTDPVRRQLLATKGAMNTCANHAETMRLVHTLLA